MALTSESFALDAAVVFRGKQMKVMGRLLLEGASGQRSFRYQLSDGDGAPVVLEQVSGARYSQLRPFPPAVRPKTTGNTIAVGVERYTLVGVRRLKILETLGQAPGGVATGELLVSGMFEGLMGTLIREMVLGTNRQVYYLVRPVGAADMLSAAAHAAGLENQRRAAGEASDD
jgi:hypothetical protein